MEDDKVAFLEEFGIKRDRQRKIIQTLRKENDVLNEDMVVVTSENQTRNDEKVAVFVNHLLEKFNTCSKVLKKEKEELNELNVQIRKVCMSFYFIHRILFICILYIALFLLAYLFSKNTL